MRKEKEPNDDTVSQDSGEDSGESNRRLIGVHVQQSQPGYGAASQNNGEGNGPRPLEVHILRTPGKVFTALRDPLTFPRDMSLEHEETAIKKAAEDYRTAFNQDKKAARNFLFMCARDVLIGVGVALFTAQLRRPDTPDTQNIPNILIVSLTILGVLVAFLKEMLDVRTEFDKNHSAQQKAMVDVQAQVEKSNKEKTALEKCKEELVDRENKLDKKNEEVSTLTGKNEALEIEVEGKKQKVSELNEKIDKLKEKNKFLSGLNLSNKMRKVLKNIEGLKNTKLSNPAPSPTLHRSQSCHF